MSLAVGSRLGAYEIVALIGAGGMGEVYRARDTRLDRTVAIKVLPNELAAEPELRERLEREARSIAALNHPHICTLHDVGQQDDLHFLVMEHLEGETLQERLQRGALPVDYALDVAIQIAEALAAAHRAGVIHRDLKPGNIMLARRSGPPYAKLLDFGLAKSGQPVASGVGGSMLPTTPPALTARGAILGTFQYMAPEQLEGLEADARSDIFAFGAVLYETVTGRKAFDARSHASLIAAVLEHEPPPFAAAKVAVPRQLEHVVRRCLAKSPDERWQTASDLHRELQWVAESRTTDVPRTDAEPRSASVWRRPISLGATVAGVVLAAVLAGSAAWMWPRAQPSSPRIARLTMALPAEQTLTSLESPPVAISPMGTHVAYVAIGGGRAQLYLRSLDSTDTTALAGTESAFNPFFSPDGQSIGFFADRKLKRISVAAGTIQVLCDAPDARGGSWAPDGTIYFAATNISGISKVSATGGMPIEVTRLDRARGEVSHRWPQVLPGGAAVMFTVWTGPARDERHVYVQRLDTGERTVVVQGGDTGRYMPTGHVVYARADELFAVPFDIRGLHVSGQPARLRDVVRGSAGTEGANFAVSDSGTLVHLPGDMQRYERRLVWVDRDGRVEPLSAPPRFYNGNTAISPDGRLAAVDLDAGTINIWIYDFSRGALAPLSTGSGSSQAPRWSSDGKRIAYRGTRAGFRNLWSKTVDDATTEERLTSGDNVQTPGAWSADGQWLVYNEGDPATAGDIWAVQAAGERKPRVIVRTRFTESFPRLSGDSRWLAYTSDESSRDEVFVQPFPGPGARVQISTEGGTEPVWSRDGRELFYRDGDRMMAVQITTTPTFTAAAPRVLFEGRYVASPNAVAAYDVAADGRFLLVQPLHPDPPTNQIQVVLNWFEELRRIAAN